MNNETKFADMINAKAEGNAKTIFTKQHNMETWY